METPFIWHLAYAKAKSRTPHWPCVLLGGSMIRRSAAVFTIMISALSGIVYASGDAIVQVASNDASLAQASSVDIGQYSLANYGATNAAGPFNGSGLFVPDQGPLPISVTMWGPGFVAAYVPIQSQTPVSFSFGAAGVEAFSFSAGGPILTAILDPSRVFPSYRLTAVASSGESYEFTSSGGIAVKAVRGSIVKVTIALFYAPASGNNYIAGGFNALRAVRGSNLVTVPGGTLPQDSGLAGQVIRDFQIGKTEVTWAEWQDVRDWAISNGYTDLAGIGGGSGPDHPVRDVNWYDVAKWCNAASEAKGLVPAYRADGAVFRIGETGTNETSEVTVMAGANGFRLPTEAEWEWAARGGANSNGYIYSGSNDLDAVAWYRSNSLGAAVPLTPLGRGTRPVRTKAPNELGLHDMNGNTWEWCWDTDATNRLIRGGSFVNNPFECAVGFRGYLVHPTARGQWRDLGFRVAKTFTQASLQQIGSIESGVFSLSPVDFADRLAFDRGTLITYQYGSGGGWPLTDGGKVHVFTTTNSVSGAGPWAYRQTLTSPDAVYDWPSFGLSLGVSSNAVFVGANSTYRVGAHDGTGYIFKRSSEGSNFAFTERWSEMPSQWAGYFSSVAALRNGLLVVSQGANASWGSYGGAYFYSLGGDGTRSKIHSFLESSFDKWVAASAIATNTASVFMASSSTNHEIRIFGISRDSGGVPAAITTNQVLTPVVGVDSRPSQPGAMDMTEDLLAVGRSLFTTNGITNCGAVDLYRKGTNGLFSFAITITPPEPWHLGQFGHSVLLVGRTLVIASPGAPKDASNAVGALYLYDVGADGSASLALTQRLQQSSNYTNEVFASSLARDSDKIAVGTTGNTLMSESPSRPELKSTGISGRILLYQVASGALGTNSPPQIASTNSFTGTVGVAFSNTVTATGSTPITFGASNLPAGLTISTNGVITGTPTSAGTNTAMLTASNVFGVTNQSATFIIAKGTPVISNWPTASSITYGQALSNSALIGGSANAAGAFGWNAPETILNAGTNSAAVTFRPDSTNNYNIVSTDISVVVLKGNAPTVSLTSPPAATNIVSVGQNVILEAIAGDSDGSITCVEFIVNGLVVSTDTTAPYRFDFSVTSVGVYEIRARATDNLFYVTDSAAKMLRSLPAEKAAPSITWANPASIIYGTPLSAAQLNATSSVAGTFSYNPPSGTVLNAGTNTLTAVFTASDPANYVSPVTNTVSLLVNKAIPSVTSWPSASSITYGQALSNSVLSGGVAGVDGSFAFVSPSTTPPVGLSTHAVRFAPTDSANYTVSTNTVTVTVNKASPVVTTLPTAGAVTEGQSLASSPLSGGSANVPGTFAWAEPGTVFSSPGIYTCPVIFTPNDTANYVPVTVQVSVNATALPTYSLSVVSSAGGTVNASPSAPYKQGTSVTLTAVPESGFVFVRWAGGATGSANPLTLTMTSNVSLQAIFSQAEPADSNTQEFVGGSRLGAGATASTAGGANAIAATPDGGTVSVGDFTGSLTILGQTYNAGVNNRGYVIKHNAQGAAQWIAVTGASGTTVKNERVAVDAAGNVLVAGTFTGTVNFGPASLTAKGNADIFVMKLSSAGVVQWVVSGGGTSAETLNGIFAGADGEVYVTGGFFGASATFGALPLAAAGTGSSNRDAFLGRVSAAGAWEWITAAGGSLADQGRAIAAAGTGVLWWAGNFQGSAAVGPNQLTSQGATDVFFAQVDAATGAITSSFRTGGTGEDAIMALLSDRAEGFYAAGSFSSSVSFGSIALSSSGVGDGYVARWQKSVQWTWAVPLQGGDDDLVTSLAMDAEGRLYAGGYFASESLAAGSSSVNNSSIFSYEGSVARFTSTGTVKWLRGIQGDNSEYVRGVACATSGALHAVGYTESALKADAVSLTAPAGLGDAFFLRMNPASTAPSRTVTVTSSRGGSVTLSPAGPSYPMGTQVTLTAVPEAGFGFTGWSGDASGTANPLTVTVNQSLTINANFADTGAPTILVTSPVNGSQAAKATVNFTGRITDNTAVTSATWALNGVDKGNLSLAQDGSFTVSNVPLVLGDNIFTVTAADAVGNAATRETSVVWSPVRTFSLPTTATISEGRLLKIPLRLNSEGNVGGLQLRLTFDPAVFAAADFEFRGAAALGFTAKNSIEGRLDLATSLGGSAIPSGIQTIGELSVRARSVPLSGVTSPINVEVVSVSDNTGSILPDGTGTSGCAVAVRARSLPADINGNGFIDSGDGSVMMSLILSQDPVARPWDVTLNDLNNSGTLDPGDVTRLLRIVVGLDPKPSPFVVPRTLRTMSMKSAMTMSAAAAQQAESYYLHEQIGKVPVTVQIAGHLDSQTITADVVLPAMGTSLNSLQFDLVYPSDLLEVSEMTKGVVAPANALFNNATASARVIFAAADSSTWASAGGTVLRVTFTRKPGVSAGAARRLITLENLAAYTNRQGGSDPLDVFQRPGVLGRPMASVLTESVGAEPDPLADTDGDGMSNAAEFAAGTDPVNRASRFEVKGFAHNPVSRAQTITWRANRGVRYRMQSSEDLSNWSAVSGTELIGDDTDVTLQVTPVGTKTKLFYRLQVAP